MAVPRGSDFSNRPEIETALKGRKVQLERESTSLDTELLATAVPIVEEDGEVLGAVRITQSVARSTGRESVSAGLVLVAGVVLAIGLIAGVFVARQMARPIQALTRSAEQIAEGDLEVRAPVEGARSRDAVAARSTG